MHRSKYVHRRPCQNGYLSFSSISAFPFESHPFTISTINDNSKSDDSTLVFHLSSSAWFHARKRHQLPLTKFFLNGPYGTPHLLIGYLISCKVIPVLFFFSLADIYIYTCRVHRRLLYEGTFPHLLAPYICTSHMRFFSMASCRRSCKCNHLFTCSYIE
jgi:hypothetical protein